MRITTLFIFILFTSSQTNGQNFKDKLFKGWGIQAGLVNTQAKKVKTPFSEKYDLLFGYNLGLSYNFRYNLYEASDNLSFGVSTAPALGVVDLYSFVKKGAWGGGSINIPLELTFDVGAGSTYNSDKNFGIALKGGIDMNIIPLLWLKNFGGKPYDNYNRFFIAPHATLAIRYFGKKGTALRELFCRYDFMKQPSGVTKEDGIGPAFLLRVGLIYFIGY